MADRQPCNQILFLGLRALGTLDRCAHHLSYQGGPKSPPHIFSVLTNLDFWTWGHLCLKKKYVLSQSSDISYMDHWPRAIYLCDRQTDRLTDRQTDKQANRQIYFAVDRPHIIVCRWAVSILSLNSLKNVLVCSRSHFP